MTETLQDSYQILSSNDGTRFFRLRSMTVWVADIHGRKSVATSKARIQKIAAQRAAVEAEGDDDTTAKDILEYSSIYKVRIGARDIAVAKQFAEWLPTAIGYEEWNEWQWLTGMPPIDIQIDSTSDMDGTAARSLNVGDERSRESEIKEIVAAAIRLLFPEETYS